MSVQPVVFLLPQMHHAKDRPQEWNAQWDSILSFSVVTPEDCLQALSSLRYHEGNDREYNSTAEDYMSHFQTTCILRLDIASHRMHYLDKDFETKWRAATNQDRRKAALVGIAAASFARNLHEMRLTMPELTVSQFADDPNYVPDYLAKVSADDLAAIPTTPFFVDPGNVWADFKKKEVAMNASKYRKLMIDQAIILRTKLFYWALLQTFLSFLGLPLREPILLKSKNYATKDEQKQQAQEALQQAQNLFGKQLGTELHNETVTAFRERQSTKRNLCSFQSCDKLEGPGVKFRRCPPCHEKVQRQVLYCSKECQTKDWKAGHKKRCGKAITDEPAIPSSIPERPVEGMKVVVPPPVAGYKRTPALLAHIAQLSLWPGSVIALKLGPGNSNSAWYVANLPGPFMTKFTAARNLAMTTGHRETVVTLCHFVVWLYWSQRMDESKNFDFNFIINYMSKEYDFPDLKSKILETQERVWADDFRRPPLFLTTSPLVWGFIVHRVTPEIDLGRRLTI